MNITSAQYLADFDDNTRNRAIEAVIDGVTWSVPLIQGNQHYDEIMRQVDAGELTIADAE
jgi:hypothetical protein